MAFWRWINVNSKIHLIVCQKILLRNRATWFVWYQRSNLLLSRLKKCTNTLNQGQEGLNHKIMIRSHYWTSKFGRLCCLQWSYPKLPSFFMLLAAFYELFFTRKYLLRGYILCVLTHTTALDQIWSGDILLKMYIRSLALPGVAVV